MGGIVKTKIFRQKLKSNAKKREEKKRTYFAVQLLKVSFFHLTRVNDKTCTLKNAKNHYFFNRIEY